MSTLELRALHKAYGTVQVLRDIDLDVAAGSRTAIVGPSGSGKTTLLRLIAGFDAPDAGTIRLEGRLLADGPAAVAAHQRRIGFVPQDGALFPHLSITDNIGFGLAEKGAERERRIDELMDMVALDRSMLARAPHELSGGQQQRVALARALAQRPHLMLLDEPFSALDTGLRAATRKAVAQLLGDAGITTVLVTHDQAEALSFADQLAVMREGRLVQSGRPLEVYRRPVDEATARFLGDAIVLPAQLEQGWAECELGRIALADTLRRGPARILLRPEQLQLAEGRADRLNGHGFYGVVTDIDFGGAECNVAVRADAGSAASQPVQVRSSSLDVPALGAKVHVSVVGQAHVFD